MNSLRGLSPFYNRESLYERDPLKHIQQLFEEPFFASQELFPVLDVVENENSIKISAELPGVSEQDVSVSFSGSCITIKGEKKSERDEEKDDRHITERRYGQFVRSLALPRGIDTQKTTAEFKKGVLYIMIPKTATDADIKEIPIRSEK